MSLADARGVQPYPGLSSFSEKEADYFHGRESQVEAVWQKLRHGHLDHGDIKRDIREAKEEGRLLRELPGSSGVPASRRDELLSSQILTAAC